MADHKHRGKPPRKGNRTGEQKGTQDLPQFSLAEVTPTLFSETAKACAKVISDNGGSGKNKSTQLRRFYDEICMWYEKVGNDDAKFKQNLPYVRMIAAKVAYARGRDLVDESFMKFMENGLNQIDSIKTFDTFKTFMEAFMGFYKMFKPK
ncbi:MAG: type III-A CRISPR-associated protein Csm2 [Exilibacterium sp.]